MTPDERDRLTRVETKLDATIKKLDAMEKSIDAMNMRFAKYGGILLALTGVGVFAGWVLAQARNLLGLFQ